MCPMDLASAREPYGGTAGLRSLTDDRARGKAVMTVPWDGGTRRSVMESPLLGAVARWPDRGRCWLTAQVGETSSSPVDDPDPVQLDHQDDGAEAGQLDDDRRRRNLSVVEEAANGLLGGGSGGDVEGVADRATDERRRCPEGSGAPLPGLPP